MLICRPKHLLSFAALSIFWLAVGGYAQDTDIQFSGEAVAETAILPETNAQTNDVTPYQTGTLPADEALATPERFNKMRRKTEKTARVIRVLNRRANSE